MSFCNNLLDVSGYFDNPFNLNIVKDNFFFNNLHFLNFSLDVGHNFFNLFNHFLSYHLNFLFWYSLYFGVFNPYFNNFLYLLDNLHNFFNISFNWYHLFDDSVDWDWYLDWNSIRPFCFKEFRNFVNDWNNSIDKYFLRDLDSLFNNLFVFFLNNINCFNDLFDFDYFFNNFLHNFRLSDVGIDWDFHFLDSILIEWNLHHFLNFNHLSVLNNSINNFLDNLWNLHNFLYDSRYNDHFLYNFLDFNYFWYFDHLLDDLININSDFFDPLDSLGHLYDLFNKDLNWIINIDINSCGFFNFDDFGYFNDSIHHLLDLDYSWVLYSLDHNLSNNFRDSHYFLLNNWNLDFPINYFLHLFDHFD